jgi:hypothetical protein
MAGQHVRSLEILEEALVAWTQEEVVYEAGLHWMKGRVLAERSVGEQAEAEASLTRSIELATARGQVPIAMRSTVELYRLGRRNRIQVELPVDRLQDHLRRFEGADEPDLLDARSLLVELTSQ